MPIAHPVDKTINCKKWQKLFIVLLFSNQKRVDLFIYLIGNRMKFRIFFDEMSVLLLYHTNGHFYRFTI